MASIRQLIREIHRRSLWQVLGIYVVGAWIVYEVIGTLYQTLGLPDWVPGVAFVLFLIGLPIVLATAFVQEGAPGPFDRGAAARAPAPAPAPVASIEAPGAAPPPRLGPVLTWNRSIAAGVLAFALLGVAASGFMGMRALGVGPAASLVATGVLDQRDPILLADFGARGVDTLLAEAVTEALRVDLEQSQVVRLYEAGRVRAALGRMERPQEAKLDEALALDLAQREGLKAVLVGDVTDAGGTYVVTARVVGMADGGVLASYRELAPDASGIIPAVDRLSRKLRGKIGESLRSVRASDPLEGVTTASLDALKLYSQAIRAFAGDVERDRSILLLREAVALDSTFAMAWRKLGAAYQNRRDIAPMVEALSRAYALRDRLTDRERYHTIATYASEVEWQPEKAVQAYLTLLEKYPDDRTALHNLGLTYGYLGRHEDATESYQRAVAVDSTTSSTYRNLAGVYAQLARFDDLEALLELYQARWPDHNLAAARAGLAAGRGDHDSAERTLRAWYAEARSTTEHVRAAVTLASHLAVRGRLAEAGRLRDEAARGHAERGAGRQALIQALDAAGDRLRLARDTAAAIRVVERGLERYPLDELQPTDRPHAQLAVFFASVGDEARALHYLGRLESEIRATTPGVFRFTPARVRGELALRAGRADVALQELRASMALAWFCRLCPDAEMGPAFDRLGQADSAIARYQRVADDPASGISAAWLLPTTLERLGELHDDAGRDSAAIRYYGRFVTLWEDADPELQPRVDAARRRIEALMRRPG